MARSHLPAAIEVRGLLERLLDREVTVAPAPPLVPGPYNPSCVGVYVDDSHSVGAVACANLSLAAHVSSCLGLQPSSAARAAVAQGKLDETLEETFHEVLNICASLLNAPGTDHTRLSRMHAPGASLPPETLARTLILGRRLDLAVDVVGYGSGRLSMVLTPT